MGCDVSEMVGSELKSVLSSRKWLFGHLAQSRQSLTWLIATWHEQIPPHKTCVTRA